MATYKVEESKLSIEKVIEISSNEYNVFKVYIMTIKTGKNAYIL